MLFVSNYTKPASSVYSAGKFMKVAGIIALIIGIAGGFIFWFMSDPVAPSFFSVAGYGLALLLAGVLALGFAEVVEAATLWLDSRPKNEEKKPLP